MGLNRLLIMFIYNLFLCSVKKILGKLRNNEHFHLLRVDCTGFNEKI